MPLSPNFFFTLPLLKFAQNTLLVIPMEAPSHLARPYAVISVPEPQEHGHSLLNVKREADERSFPREKKKKIVQSTFCSYVRFLEKFALSFFLISLNQSKDGSNSLLALRVYLLQIKIISSFRKKFKRTRSFE